MCGDSLNQIAKQAQEINEKNGWYIKPWEATEDARSIATCIALIHSEASEALQAYRNDDKKMFGEELADIMIRTMSLAFFLKIDIDKEIMMKLEKNENRGFRHGGKRV